MQNLNRAMTSMARVLHAIDNNPPMTGVSDEMVEMVEQMRDLFWDLKTKYPDYAGDQPYNVVEGSGGPGIMIYEKTQVPPTVVIEESQYYPSVIIIDDY